MKTTGLGNQPTYHDLFGERLERRMETTVEFLIASLVDTLLENVGPFKIQKLVDSLTFRKVCELDGNAN